MLTIKNCEAFYYFEGGRYEDKQKFFHLSLCIVLINLDGLLPSIGC
jgi:hypothetical protein